MLTARGISLKGRVRSNRRMDIFSIRRERLRQLILDDFKGNQAAFSEHTKIKPPQINRWLSMTAADPRKITETSARSIEQKTNKPAGWLDSPGSMDRRLTAVPSPPLETGAFSIEERALLDGFRLADPVTRRHMIRMAQESIENFSRRTGENHR
jgi:hypothetical protein